METFIVIYLLKNYLNKYKAFTKKEGLIQLNVN